LFFFFFFKDQHQEKKFFIFLKIEMLEIKIKNQTRYWIFDHTK